MRLHRLLLLTARGPLAPLWRRAYDLLARVYAAWLAGGNRNASVYAAGGVASGDAALGLSDIDLAVIVEPGRGDRERVLARRRRLERALPWVSATLLDRPIVVRSGELADGARVSVFDVAAPVYHGSASHPDLARLRERPGPAGQPAEWRLLRGPERRPRVGAARGEPDPVAAWLEVQRWWRWWLQDCLRPPGPRSAALCFKVVAESARAWLWLAHGEWAGGRREVLERALRRLPEEEAAFRSALDLERRLAGAPPAPREEFAGHAVRLADRVARATAAALPATTEVRLAGGGDDLVLSPRALGRLRGLPFPAGAPALHPLADWRALARAHLGAVPPASPDEALVEVELDPASPSGLRTAAAAAHDDAYTALRHGGLLVLASARWPRTQLRAVQHALSDPASFALLERRSSAAYPRTGGWSIETTARRAVAEHAAWLAGPARGAGGAELGTAITAARAGLLAASVRDGSPELPLTVAATLRGARATGDVPAPVAEAAAESYREWRRDGADPPAALVRELRAAVGRMPDYRG